MRVRFCRPDLTVCSPHELSYYSSSQAFFAEGNEYDVHAVSMYDGVTFLLVVDNLKTPSFHPRIAFDTISSEIPADWICSVFASGPVQLVLGPAFIARDVESYNSMVDQEMAQVERFWQRLEATTRLDGADDR
jgi:hypothetical protein